MKKVIFRNLLDEGKDVQSGILNDDGTILCGCDGAFEEEDYEILGYGNRLLDLAPSKRKNILLTKDGNSYSWNSTPEFANFLDSEAWDTFVDVAVRVAYFPKLAEIEKRLISRYVAESGYAGEDPKGDNYLLWHDWFPAMSAEEMDVFAAEVQAWWGCLS